MSSLQCGYDKTPVTVISGQPDAIAGWQAIVQTIAAQLAEKNFSTLVVECYPGTNKTEVTEALQQLHPAQWIDADSYAYKDAELDALLQDELTDDRVFGVLTTRTLDSLFPEGALDKARAKLGHPGLTVVIGTGAALITRGDMLVYCDLTRWEIQLRYRRGMSNWNTHNPDAPILTKYKRGFFVEWRVADKLKKQLLPTLDFLISTCIPDAPAMVSGDAFREGLHQVSTQPFRLRPYFDPGVWGGQWMKKVCGLPAEAENYAWAFDGVPEENAIGMQYGGTTLWVPAIDLVFFCPDALLGARVHARFGTEFPIRFDFLDTVQGQNLSLQVHPLTEYIQEKFNMRYTQDESYYILDAPEEGGYVYLGIKSGTDPEEMAAALRRAEKGEAPFPAEQFVNKVPVKKHDHVLIPAGTVHCSGAGCMVLEVSATPYIFTFKLWDWGRVGLDGLPRPIHLDHGLRNIQWNRNTEWVNQRLIHQERLLGEGDGWKAERTGLYETEFIDTVRYTLDKPHTIASNGSVRMCNLVEGSEVELSSPQGAFAPYRIHYAETFILPDAAGDVCITPIGGPASVLEASVRP